MLIYNSESMEVASDFRSWDELIPDALGVIFTHLSVQERLTIVPSVCKSWADLVAGPYCWQEIDIDEWSSCCEPDKLDPLLEMLITRSSGSLRKLCVSCIQTERMFIFIAENAPSLETLRLSRCNINDSIVEQFTRRLSMLSFLDVSYCTNIGARALETIGNNCKLLEGLCRNMHPLDTAGKNYEDDEANAIASTMTNLKHLEMTYHLIKTTGVLKILSNCHKLEFLDLRGCWGVQLENISVEQNFPRLKVYEPFVTDFYEKDEWEDFSESSEYLTWDFVAGDMNGYYDDESDIDDEMWDDEGRLEELEFRFYQGIEDAEMFWPPSP
ncbi:PREDICTED: F-box protein FBW2-like isoform X2 [Lupinus angustifolius]|uniref:F-box protein FBW2-like isoform X2 n=1 Tax=Lupinus angustifolius TaxID=3871 RepID=UPI00092E214C|nr:PREDICTED: F-box protein FBW2-like isoform X2 [Lupinus angustifolius]